MEEQDALALLRVWARTCKDLSTDQRNSDGQVVAHRRLGDRVKTKIAAKSVKNKKSYLVDLPLVDFFLHGSMANKAVNEHAFSLAKSIDSEERLNIMSRIPGRIKDDDTICAYKICSDSTSFC